ncbi:MAG TPA: DUF1326 domain-containing protein [bacterium]|nr:DUF1326 domain-containing protein [bacterium]
MATNWSLTGDYFESCNCEAACPCVFLSPPTTGECNVIVAWHVDSGSYGDVKLDGLNVALAVHSPGHMAQVKWKAAVYLDDKANDAQADALTQIFSGQAGGHPAVLASFVGEIVGMSKLPITYANDGKGRSLKLGTVGNVAIQPVEGQGGAQITVNNHPLCISPGHPATVHRSSELKLKDAGFDWAFSGKTGFQSPFAYQGG